MQRRTFLAEITVAADGVDRMMPSRFGPGNDRGQSPAICRHTRRTAFRPANTRKGAALWIRGYRSNSSSSGGLIIEAINGRSTNAVEPQ
jgi:hypothetical protein